jgi:hypothetical protein
MFLVCSSSIFDIVMIDNEFMHKISKRLIQYLSGLGGRLYVSKVLRYSLPAVALYMSSLVIDHSCDTPVESFVAHSPHNRLSRTRLPREIKLHLYFSLLVMFLMHR